MRLLRTAGLVLAATLCGIAPAVAQDGESKGPPLVFRLHDERVLESSGLALSRSRPGLAYTVNDSGDDARVLVVSMKDGAVVGETRLAGVEADDFEALARAPGGRLVVGDIGDNDAERDSVEVYVLGEPGSGRREVRPRTVSLTYAEGPRDAEGMVVVGKTLFVVSKEALGGVFSAPLLSSGADDLTLRRVAPAPSVVTGAALLADGDVVMRDYAQGYLVSLPGWRVRGSFRLPRVEQGETVAAALRGRYVYVGTEGSHSPVYRVAVPTFERAAPPSADLEPSAGQRGAQPGPDGTGLDDLRARPVGYVLAVAAALVVALAVRRRRRGRKARITVR